MDKSNALNAQNHSRQSITWLNAIISTALFWVLFFVYFFITPRDEWRLNAPYQMQSFGLRRNTEIGVFERDAKVRTVFLYL